MQAVTAQLGPQADPGSLDGVIRQVIADGYLAGGAAARQQLGPNSVTIDGDTGAAIAGVDWDAWTPGDPGAAAQAADGGLARLLDNSGIGIKGITDSALDGLGNQIADGVLTGASVDDIAGSLSEWVTGARAERIAHTESARAVTAATLDTYQANGIGSWSLVLSDGACELCEDVADGGPYPADDDQDAPPLHPYCRCSASPNADDYTGDGSEDGSGDGLGGLLGDVAGLLGSDGGDVAAEDLADTGLAETAADQAGDALGADDTAAPNWSAMSDDDLAEALGDADDDQVNAILSELDRRDEAARAAEKKAQQAADRKAKADAKAAALEEQRGTEFDAALAAGEDAEEAYARIWGLDVEKMRTQEAIASLRRSGYTGRNFEELAQSAFKDYAEQSRWNAEAETNGYLVNNAGVVKGIDPLDLFTGTEARARKWASDELLQYWQDHGRLTVDDFKASLLGGAMRSAGTAAFR